MHSQWAQLIVPKRIIVLFDMNLLIVKYIVINIRFVHYSPKHVALSSILIPNSVAAKSARSLLHGPCSETL
jgi:hypothetical protein